MKKWFNKIKTNFKNATKGFSLVELIVVIAIMAVMAAVLAPALLGYVERSRAQKDDSALSEVVNSVQLSLADQNVYDEMLKYSAEQYSCYVDSDSPDDANKVDIKAGKYYMYSDEERQLDETVYKLDGVMRGVTITFAPDAAASNNATLDLIKGHVNKYLPSGKKTYGGLTGAAASPKLADIPESELYNSLRATVGDKIAISSQTYRNSEYTIFISMGTTGGQEAAAQDAIKVWGQFSGTNLPEGSSVASNGSNTGTAAGSNEFKEPSNGGGSPAVTLPAKGKTLAEYTWPEVQQIIQAGKTAEYNFKVGDLTRTFTINNKTNKQARIVDINGNRVTFMLTSSIGSHNMNAASADYPDGDNIGGYADSEMKVWLDETVYNSLDADLKAVISPATITCADGYNSPNGTKSATCYLFLPSIKEVGLNNDISGWYSYMTAIEAEGETFDWFAEGGCIDRWFWLRSPRSNYVTLFFGYGNGSGSYDIAHRSYSVYPAFVIS